MKRFMILVVAALCISLCVSVAHAASSVKITDRKDRVNIDGGVTAEILAEVKKEVGDGQGVTFVLNKIGHEDLAKICGAFPGMRQLSIMSPQELTAIAPVAQLKNLTRFELVGGTVADFSPLSDLTELTGIRIVGPARGTGMMAPDFKWMSKLTNLTELQIGSPGELRPLVSFEGIPAATKVTTATISGAAPADLTPLQALSGVKSLALTGSVLPDLTPLTGLPALEELRFSGSAINDFSPLAGSPSLRRITMEAMQKGVDFSTLGKLPQLQALHVNGWEIVDISWITGMTNLKSLNLVNTKTADVSPLAQLQLEELLLAQMHVPVNMSQLSGVTSLKKLELAMNKGIAGFEGLASLVNVEELTLRSMNAKDGTPVDMAFVGSLINLKKLVLNRAEVSGNFDAVANCVKLESVEIRDTTGITSLDALKKLPNLTSLQVPKGMFTEEQLAGFANPKIRIRQ